MESQSNILLDKITSTMWSLLNAEITSVRNEIEQLKDSVVHMSAQYDDILKDQTEAKLEIKKLTEDNGIMSTLIKDMSVRINTLEQNVRTSNIELQCVPQKKDENLMNIVKQLGKAVDYELKDENVLKVSNETSRPKSIVVQLSTQRLRDTFLAACIIIISIKIIW